MNTAKFVANELRKMGLTVYEGTGKTGIVADLKAGEGKTVIGLRADMDAIQLEEPGKGSKAMIDDGLFEKYSIDEIYVLHNIPFIPAGEILFSSKKGLGAYSAAAPFSLAAFTCRFHLTVSPRPYCLYPNSRLHLLYIIADRFHAVYSVPGNHFHNGASHDYPVCLRSHFTGLFRSGDAESNGAGHIPALLYGVHHFLNIRGNLASDTRNSK